MKTIKTYAYKHLLAILMLVSISGIALCQTAPTSSQHHIKHLEKQAKTYFDLEEYAPALQYYLDLDSLVPNNGMYNYFIGVCYFHTVYKNKALKHFLVAKDQKYPDYNFEVNMGRAYHFNHLFDDAIFHYSNYLKTVDTSHKQYSVPVADVKRWITACENGKKYLEDSVYVKIENIGAVINSPYPDYSPVINADETMLLFTSRRPGSTGNEVDPADGFHYEDIYVSYKVNGQWQTPINIGDSINTRGHDACIGISQDGKQIFIYRSTPDRKLASGDILVSHYGGDNNWSRPVRLEGDINSKNWEASATLSHDGKMIVFSSDRPGGYGGTDLWVVKMQPDGTWGLATNLGPEINTPYDEDSPDLHDDQHTLYFSSRGHTTMGGFDIFTSVMDEKTGAWNAPVNLGYPINTPDDDIYFTYTNDGTKGYYASYRSDSYGEKDIYIVHRPSDAKDHIILVGTVFSALDSLPLSAQLIVTRADTRENMGTTSTDPVTGKYSLELIFGATYNVTVRSSGYLFYSEVVDVPEHNDLFSLEKDFYLEQLSVGTKMVLKNIFFDYDKATIRPESNTELENLYTLMKTNPAVVIEISGHTDSHGSDRYNKKLSEARALAVVKYLVDRGIEKNRLVAVGYGEEQPIADNNTPEGAQLNRRTEFKIINAPTPGQGLDLTTALNDPTYRNPLMWDPAVTAAYYHAQTNPAGSTSNGNTQSPYAVGAVLPFKAHFDANNAKTLTQYTCQRLDLLVALMKEYQTMTLELLAYANQGVEGNMEYLKQARAQLVMNYLIKNGITKERISVTLATPTSPTDDIAFRRVEFRVVTP